MGPNWYYPSVLYPDYYYYNGWVGYEYQFQPFGVFGGHNRQSREGLELDLSPITDKDLRKYAEKGIIQTLDGNTWKTEGAVKRYEKQVLHLDPGTYNIKIVFPDKKELDMAVEVREGKVTHAPISFSEPQAQPQTTQSQQSPPSKSAPASSPKPQLIPAQPPQRQ